MSRSEATSETNIKPILLEYNLFILLINIDLMQNIQTNS